MSNRRRRTWASQPLCREGFTSCLAPLIEVAGHRLRCISFKQHTGREIATRHLCTSAGRVWAQTHLGTVVLLPQVDILRAHQAFQLCQFFVIVRLGVAVDVLVDRAHHLVRGECAIGRSQDSQT